MIQTFARWSALALGTTLLAAAGVAIAEVPAQAALHDCWPRAAAITMANKRVVGNGSASCGLATTPEHMRITVMHHYPLVPDARAFFGITTKPKGAVNWTGGVRRCDNATTAEYYTVVQMTNWAQNGTKKSGRTRVATCAGTGS